MLEKINELKSEIKKKDFENYKLQWKYDDMVNQMSIHRPKTPDETTQEQSLENSDSKMEHSSND